MPSPRATRRRGAAPGAAEGEQPAKKQVYRLLKRGDVKKALVGEEVFVLWPDNGTWYRATVEDLSVKGMTADLFYSETEEQETANLAELIEEGQIAFLEERSAGHVCSSDEIELGTAYFGRQAGEGAAAAGGSGDAGEEEEEESEEDAGAAVAESDPSFSSAEAAGGGKKAGGGSSSDSEDSEEEVKLEEFEKRELLRDMSDDEKPLYTRMTEAERKQRRAAAAQRRQAAAAAAAAAGQPAPPAKAAAPAVAAAAAEAETEQQRPRRRASAGVAAATQALAAAAGVRIGELEPTKPRHEEDEEAAAEAYTQKLLANLAPQKSVERGAFYGGRQSSGKLEKHGSVGGQSDEDLRKKARAFLKEGLDLVAKEVAEGKAWGDSAAEGAEAELPDPGAVATAVEAALLQLYGGVTKDYKRQLLSLRSNLKDPHNPELRGKVLRGHLAPDRLVRMTPVELASRELAEYRKQKEQESLKMSVLDAEAAARFSTAAALDARDSLALPAELVGDKLLSARDEPQQRGGARRSPSPLPDRSFGAADAAGARPAAGAAQAPAPAGPAAAGAAAVHVSAAPALGGPGVDLAMVDAEDGGAGGRGAYTVSEAAGDAHSPAAGVPAGGDAAGEGDGEGEGEAYDPEKGLEDEDLGKQGQPLPGAPLPPPPPPGSPPRPSPRGGPGGANGAAPAAAGIDWASIKAKALQESAAVPAQPALEPFGSLPLAAPSSDSKGNESQEGSARKRSHHHHHHHHHHHSPHGGSRPPPSPRDSQPPDAPPDSPAAEPPSPGSLAHLLQPQPEPQRLLGRGVWEGQFVIPGAGAFLLAADALAGSGDVAGMLGEQEIELKGRVPVAKLDTFLVELRRSKNRTVTAALLRPADEATPDERAVLKDVAGQYRERQRTGFGEARQYQGAGGASERIEVYIVPGGELARRVLAAARGMEPAVVDAALPGGANDLGDDQLLLLLIHKRDWRDWFSPGDIPRPLKRRRAHPPPQLPQPGGPTPATSLPPPPPIGGQPPMEQPVQPGSTAAPPAASGAPAPGTLPNIDWAALSAITASLGVAPGGSAPAPGGGPAPGAAPPALPDLSGLMQQAQLQPQQPQPVGGPGPGPAGGFAGGGALDMMQMGWVTSQPAPAPVQPVQGGMLGAPGMLPMAPPPAQPGLPPPQQQPQQQPVSLPFDPAQLELLLKSTQQAQPAQQAQQGGSSGGKKRKSRWEQEGGEQQQDQQPKERKSRWEPEAPSGAAGAAGGEGGAAGPQPPPAAGPLGPMRREVPGTLGGGPSPQHPGAGAPPGPAGTQQLPPQQQQPQLVAVQQLPGAPPGAGQEFPPGAILILQPGQHPGPPGMAGLPLGQPYQQQGPPGQQFGVYMLQPQPQDGGPGPGYGGALPSPPHMAGPPGGFAQPPPEGHMALPQQQPHAHQQQGPPPHEGPHHAQQAQRYYDSRDGGGRGPPYPGRRGGRGGGGYRGRGGGPPDRRGNW